MYVVRVQGNRTLHLIERLKKLFKKNSRYVVYEAVISGRHEDEFRMIGICWAKSN
jgi:hypothetical protein